MTLLSKPIHAIYTSRASNEPRLSVPILANVNRTRPVHEVLNDVHLVPGFAAGYSEDGVIFRQSTHNRNFKKNITAAPDTTRLSNTFDEFDTGIYGGLIHGHFGHFLTESISRLWLSIGLDDLPIFFFQRDPLSVSMTKVVETVFQNILRTDRLVVIDRPSKIRELIIPEPSWIDTGTCKEEQRMSALHLRSDFSELIGNKQQNRSGLIYLSRRNLNPMQYGFVAGEEELEKKLLQIGFRIVHPENLSFVEQVALFDGAELVVGIASSSFHTMLFSDCSGLACIYLCKSNVNANFVNIDSLVGADANYVPAITLHPYAIKPIYLLNVRYAFTRIVEHLRDY